MGRHGLPEKCLGSQIRYRPKKLVPSLAFSASVETEKDRAQDLSDIVRRVGAPLPASARGGFEIYVDPTLDPGCTG